MRSLRFDGRSVVLDTSGSPPAPGPGEAQIRPLRIGISATDLAIARGSLRPPAPLVIGHEFVGVVEQLNIPDDAPQMLRDKRSLKGRRVVGSPTVVCGHCDMCRSGLAPHCRHRAVAGLSGRNGCMADRFCMPAANLLAVPEGVDDDTAIFANPLATATHAAQLARSAAKSFVAVLGGDGRSEPGAATLHPLLTAFALSRFNPSTRLLTQNPALLSVCEKWGIKHRPTPEAGRRQDQDVVVECTATASGLRLAMQFVRPRGTIVVASPVLCPPFPPNVPFPENPPPDWAKPIDLTPLIAGEVNLVCCRDGPPGAGESLHLLQRGELDARTLITRRFKLDDGPAALQAAADAGQLKVVLEL